MFHLSFEKCTIYKHNYMGLKKVLIVLYFSRDDEAIILLICVVCFRNSLAKSSLWKRVKLLVKLTASNNAFLLGGFFAVDSISTFSSSMISTISLVIWCSNSSSQSTLLCLIIGGRNQIKCTRGKFIKIL